jgi:methylphosphotriester-DNA--protein-cysteine methyltransferase
MNGDERLMGWMVTIIGVVVFGIICQWASCAKAIKTAYNTEWYKSYRSCIEAGHKPAECRTP